MRIGGRLSAYLINVAWAVLWRFALLAGAIVVEELGYRPPLILVAEFAGFAGVGVFIGLWRRRSSLAAAWRMLTVSVLVAFGGPAAPPVYPYLLVLALALVTLEPFLAATKRRRTLVEDCWVPVADSPAADRVGSGEPAQARAGRLRGVMKGLAYALLLTGVAAGGYSLYSNPGPAAGVAGAVQQVGQHAADWVHGVVGSTSTSPSASPAPLPGTLILAPRGGLPAVSWSAADCSWANATLTRDTQLDLAEAHAVAAGSDVRYGTGPDLVAYYQQYGAEWTEVNAEVSAICSDHAAPTFDQIAKALSWFYGASEAHRADTATNPDDADWNNAWIANYARLGVLFGNLPD